MFINSSLQSNITQSFQRGVALISYALLLAFICATGYTLLGTDTLSTGVKNSVTNSQNLLGYNSREQKSSNYYKAIASLASMTGSEKDNLRGKIPDGGCLRSSNTGICKIDN